MYKNHMKTLHQKSSQRSNIVDMTFLWLWWISYFDEPNYESGSPFTSPHPNANEDQIKEFKKISDDSFRYSKSLSLPTPDKAKILKLCNGLNVVNRTVFDHYHAWAFGRNFSLNIYDTKDPYFGVPYVIGPSLSIGGIPESVIPIEVEKLKNEKLYLNNIHYQGGAKGTLTYDVCRVLYATGDKMIYDPIVKEICEKEKIIQKNAPAIKHMLDDSYIMA